MTDSWWLDYPAQAECWTDSCFMSQETADWYSGNNTLLHSGSLWWPCCCQWQHLRQHHRDMSTNIHIFSHEHTHTHRAISYKALFYILSLSVSPSLIHSSSLTYQLHTSLCCCPRSAVSGLQWSILCWRLRCVCVCERVLKANALLSALCRVVCAHVCRFTCMKMKVNTLCMVVDIIRRTGLN